MKTSLSIIKELFIFSLVLYLVLFILETIFPGFVSNNFNLNWVLGVVLVLGIVSAFSPDAPKEEGKPKVTDYLTAIFLAILGGALIFAKIELEQNVRLIVAFLSGSLILGLSLVLLMSEDEEIKTREEEIETFVQSTFLSRKTFTTPIAFFRLLLFKKVNFPLFLILIVFLFTTLALPQKSVFFQSAPVSEQTAEPTPTPSLIPTPTPTISPSTNLVIKVLNGGVKKEIVDNFVKMIKNAGFQKVFFGEADKYTYKNALIQFRPEDKDQADLIKNLLKDEYSTFTEAPSATTSAELTIILGTEEESEEVTILSPE